MVVSMRDIFPRNPRRSYGSRHFSKRVYISSEFVGSSKMNLFKLKQYSTNKGTGGMELERHREEFLKMLSEKTCGGDSSTREHSLPLEPMTEKEAKFVIDAVRNTHSNPQLLANLVVLELSSSPNFITKFIRRAKSKSPTVGFTKGDADVSASEALAYLWYWKFASSEDNKHGGRKCLYRPSKPRRLQTTCTRHLLVRISARMQIVFTTVTFPPPHNPRTFLTKCVWCRSNGTGSDGDCFTYAEESVTVAEAVELCEGDTVKIDTFRLNLKRLERSVSKISLRITRGNLTVVTLINGKEGEKESNVANLVSCDIKGFKRDAVVSILLQTFLKSLQDLQGELGRDFEVDVRNLRKERLLMDDEHSAQRKSTEVIYQMRYSQRWDNSNAQGRRLTVQNNDTLHELTEEENLDLGGEEASLLSDKSSSEQSKIDAEYPPPRERRNSQLDPDKSPVRLSDLRQKKGKPPSGDDTPSTPSTPTLSSPSQLRANQESSRRITNDMNSMNNEMNSIRYTDDENGIVQAGKDLMKEISKQTKEETKTVRVNTGPLTKSFVYFDRSSNIMYGRSRLTIHASCKDILSYFWVFCARCTTTNLDIEREVVEVLSPRRKVFYCCKRDIGWNSENTKSYEFLMDAVWQKIGSSAKLLGEKSTPQESERKLSTATSNNYDNPNVSTNSKLSMISYGTYLMAFLPTSHPLRPETKSRHRVLNSTVLLIKENKNGFCSVEKFLKLDFQKRITNGKAISQGKAYLERINRCQFYFLKTRKLSDLSMRDGRALGEFFYSSFNLKNPLEKVISVLTFQNTRQGSMNSKHRVRKFLNDHISLKEFSEDYPWVERLLIECMKNRLRPAKKVLTHLNDMTDADAVKIGQSLAAKLRARKSASAGIDQWQLAYPAIDELIKEHQWFLPFMQVVGQRCLENAVWGVFVRVIMGASLALLDVISDIIMVINYLEEGETRFAYPVITMISLSLLFQLLLVFGQYRKCGLQTLLVESLYVITFTKPGIDAYRIATGAVKKEEHLLPPLMELTYNKSIEMSFEAIPSSIFQLYAFIISPRRPQIAIYSILISIFTIAFVSTTISYDLDVDPTNRRVERKFYGAVPNSSYRRTVTFFSLFAFTVISCSFKTISCAFMAATSVPLFAFMVSCEAVAALLYKIARGDYLYWFPLNGVVAIVISAFQRVATQIMSGCTAMIHLRHPLELGGAWWSITIIWTHLSAYSSVYAYGGGMRLMMATFGGRKRQGEEIDTDYIFGFLSILTVLWFATGLTMLFFTKEDYRGTFWSLQTGKGFIVDKFRTSCDSDASKADCILFINHKLISELKDDIRSWISKSYIDWEYEGPKWYTSSGVQFLSLPKGFVPEDIYHEIKRKNTFKSNTKGLNGSFNRMKTSAEIILLTTGRVRINTNEE